LASRLDFLIHLVFFLFVGQKRQATQKDISGSIILFDFTYGCGIRKERLSSCLSRPFDAVHNLSLLEEVMKLSFQKVPISSLREVFILLWRLLFFLSGLLIYLLPVFFRFQSIEEGTP